MVRRLYLALAVVVVVVVAAAGILSYLAQVAGQQRFIEGPAQISLAYGNQQYSGAQGSYCWRNAVNEARCVDYASAGSRNDIPSPINVSAGSSICFEVTGYPNPGIFHVAISPADNSSSASVDVNVSGCMVVSVAPGNYYFTAFGAWTGRDTSNVFALHVT